MALHDMNNPLDLALICVLRRLAAQYLLKNAYDDEVGGGISFDIWCSAQGYAGIDEFCQKVVLAMGVEAEGIVLNTLPVIFGVGLRVVVLDRRDTVDLLFSDYPDEEAITDDGHKPVIHLQLRPGHYDLFYFQGPKESKQQQELHKRQGHRPWERQHREQQQKQFDEKKQQQEQQKYEQHERETAMPAQMVQKPASVCAQSGDCLPAMAPPLRGCVDIRPGLSSEDTFPVASGEPIPHHSRPPSFGDGHRFDLQEPLPLKDPSQARCSMDGWCL